MVVLDTIMEIHQPTGRSSRLDLENTNFDSAKRHDLQQTPLSGRLATLFIPQGYPNSVAPGYMRYQMWDLIQGLTSYLRAQLAMKEMLAGFGVGNVVATAAASAMSKVIIDGLSKVGSLVFTWWNATEFGYHLRQWRLFADVINDLGMTLEMIAPLCGVYFLPVACMAGIFSAMCGVSAGATKTAISEYFALQNNLTDLVSKEQAQEEAVSLIGLVCGYAFLSLLQSQQRLIVWSLFTVLTVIHVVANIYAVREIRLRTVNECRFNLLYRAFREDIDMSVDAISMQEPLLPQMSRARVVFGTRLSSHIDLADTQKRYHCSGKLVLSLFGIPAQCVDILLHRDCTPLDILEARFEAERLSSDAKSADFAAFRSRLDEHGWNTNINLFALGPWRYDWNAKKEN